MLVIHHHCVVYYCPHTKYDARLCFQFVCLYTGGGGGTPDQGRYTPPSPLVRTRVPSASSPTPHRAVRRGRYASCVHAGGLSCLFFYFCVFLISLVCSRMCPQIYVRIKISPFTIVYSNIQNEKFPMYRTD